MNALSPISTASPMIAQTEKRAHRRFPLSLTTQLQGSWPTRQDIDSETLDVSAGGVLFRVKRELSIGEEVEFLLRFGPDLTMTSPPLLVRFWGKVVRADRGDLPGYDHTIAVEIRRYEFGSAES
ncbi:MAG TPA: PilZ domain-containing protein [Terriglobales bacterium]|nr:PilZ domain-containing protein [Terriglobales bacterium]